MVKEVLQVTGREVEVTENKVAVTKQPPATKGKRVRVESRVFTPHAEATTTTSGAFTRDAYEDTLDEVSRSVKGKYAHVPYSSEDLIRDKRKEVELEDR